MPKVSRQNQASTCNMRRSAPITLAHTSVSPMELKPGQYVGPYRLIRLLGAGGMGEVYEAINDRIARQVAIKILFPELAKSKETATRFLNEARAVNITRHPGLVQIFDHGQLPDGTTYIVMEFLSGKTLSQTLQDKGGALPEAEVLRIAPQIAHALKTAHQKGIVHRDLKPANVMLVQDVGVGGGLRAKLLDFGIAKVARENQAGGSLLVQTKEGEVMGSPLYMSPEQCRGGDAVRAASDVYSFGALLYHLLAGRAPFQAETAAQVLGMHLFEQATPLQKHAPQISEELASLVDSMLQKDPAQRPSMAEISMRLEKLAERMFGNDSGNILQRRIVIAATCSIVALLGVWIALYAGTAAHPTKAPARVCSDDGFCRESLPQDTARLLDVIAFSPTDIWACGDPASIVHFDGTSWKKASFGLSSRIHDLFAFHASNIWAVGANGTVAHYDGIRWKIMESDTRASLTGIWGAHARDLWVSAKALDGQSQFLHFDGERWTPWPTGTSSSLQVIWGAHKDAIWSGGNDGTLLRYRDRQWKQVPGLGIKEKITGLWGTSDRNVWVSGHKGLLLHFDGDKWSSIDTGTKFDLNDGASFGPDESWIVGDQGVILRIEGQRISPFHSGVETHLNRVFGISRPGRSLLWAAGDSGTLLSRAWD